MPSSCQARLHIGTSGWSYDHWTGPFYPPGLPARERLAYYARRLASAEINASFYRLPSPQTLEGWQRSVPDGFVFAVKASRYITHLKKLKDPREGLDRLLDRMSLLGDRLGPVLFQLPPHWHFDQGRLGQFLAELPSSGAPAMRFVLELRDRTWLNDEALDLLERARAAFCIYELDGFLSPRSVTADFVYVRLHGPDGPYRGSYDHVALSAWAARCAAWLREGLDVYCYFDNDEAGYAASNALALRRMLEPGGAASDS